MTEKSNPRPQPVPSALDHPAFHCLWRAAESYSATPRSETCAD